VDELQVGVEQALAVLPQPSNWLRVSLERKRDVKKRYSVGAQERFEGCEKGDGYAFRR
jgi:hypothetical protein